jgi:hypothetical protein
MGLLNGSQLVHELLLEPLLERLLERHANDTQTTLK